MDDMTESPRSLLKEYAETLIANSKASTQKELDEVADELIYITGKLEAHGQAIAQTIHDLLGDGGGPEAQ